MKQNDETLSCVRVSESSSSTCYIRSGRTFAAHNIKATMNIDSSRLTLRSSVMCLDETLHESPMQIWKNQVVEISASLCDVLDEVDVQRVYDSSQHGTHVGLERQCLHDFRLRKTNP